MQFWRIASPWILLLTYFSAGVSCAEVTLEFITIFKTHEVFGSKPTVYFLCEGENKSFLPDVRDANVSYTFKGQESWQPLTEFNTTKCKRCGLYEEDQLSSDDVFGNWEFCPSDFSGSKGHYRYVKEKEFSATFLCPGCLHLLKETNQATESHNTNKMSHTVVAIIITLLVSSVIAVGVFAAYKYWQKKKRQHDQARFLKLFEEGDDLDDELGLGP